MEQSCYRGFVDVDVLYIGKVRNRLLGGECKSELLTGLVVIKPMDIDFFAM
jgi:hypothetical protein